MARVSPSIRWPRAALLALLIGLHAALWLLPSQRLLVPRQEPLAVVYLPQTTHSSGELHRMPAKRRGAAIDRATQPIGVPPTIPAAQGRIEPTPRIDWDAEAAITAQHPTQFADGPQPRSLDDHQGHGSHQDGVGLNSHEVPEFGWNQTAIHRFDTRGEIPIIRLSDRCVLPLGPFIPLPWCGFGKKIEPRGDLFEHMRDAPAPAQP